MNTDQRNDLAENEAERQEKHSQHKKYWVGLSKKLRSKPGYHLVDPTTGKAQLSEESWEIFDSYLKAVLGNSPGLEEITKFCAKCYCIVRMSDTKMAELNGASLHKHGVKEVHELSAFWGDIGQDKKLRMANYIRVISESPRTKAKIPYCIPKILVSQPLDKHSCFRDEPENYQYSVQYDGPVERLENRRMNSGGSKARSSHFTQVLVAAEILNGCTGPNQIAKLDQLVSISRSSLKSLPRLDHIYMLHSADELVVEDSQGQLVRIPVSQQVHVIRNQRLEEGLNTLGLEDAANWVKDQVLKTTKQDVKDVAIALNLLEGLKSAPRGIQNQFLEKNDTEASINEKSFISPEELSVFQAENGSVGSARTERLIFGESDPSKLPFDTEKPREQDAKAAATNDSLDAKFCTIPEGSAPNSLRKLRRYPGFVSESSDDSDRPNSPQEFPSQEQEHPNTRVKPAQDRVLSAVTRDYWKNWSQKAKQDSRENKAPVGSLGKRQISN